MKALFKMKPTALAVGIIVATSAVVFDGPVVTGDGFSSWIPAAVAAQGQGGKNGRMGGQGQGGGGQGTQGNAGQGQRGGGGKSVESLLADDGDDGDDGDDSDRPDWAQGNKEANPHRGDPNPTPGDNKGDEYGDLYVVVRDPLTGVPDTVDGELKICTDPACDSWELTVDGEVPAGVTPIEVEFGRLNIGRAPDKVLEHALDEAMSKIESATTLSLDPAGRIVVDGATIDSPLENLALYIAMVNWNTDVASALQSLPIEISDLAAAALGAAADKTGEITIDLVYYTNNIYDLDSQGLPYIDYGLFTYDRTFYDQVVSYFYMDGDAVMSAEVNLAAYLTATQPTLDDASGITLFSIAADDALEAVELLHTQIHDDVLPGTIGLP